MSRGPTELPLAGRVALVTGASRTGGIGFAIAKRLAEDGADLVVHAFEPYDAAQAWHAAGDLEAVLPALRTTGRRVHLVEADLGESDAPERVVAAAFECLGQLDIVVANHTHWEGGGVRDVTGAQLDRHLAVIVRATLLLVGAFARRRAAGPGGRAILLVTGSHRGAMPGEIAYAAAKGALVAATASLARELGPQGICVNAVNPGPTDTGWVSPALRDQLAAESAFGRVGEPDDAARLVAWLASDAGAWLTGQVLNSEGGFRL